MRLRNKKTGEIVEEVRSSMDSKDRLRIYDMVTDKYYAYNSLAELNEEWEDYEEKTAWFIDPQGDIQEWRDADCDDWTNEKQIGNYFKTKEEAEKAVEKLKAWKRLKDNGYRFNGVGVEYDGYKIHLECDIMKKEHYTPTQDHKDMDLLFGGEE